jgi:serine/threonine protein kinase
MEEVLAIGRDIARALAKAHQAGVAHRDIKPENVFITQPSAGTMLAKVLDFGLARQRTPKAPGVEHTQTDTTTAGQMWGTPGYLSPEQAHGQSADSRSDVFSFGVVLYEMLTGRRAFRGDNAVALLLAVAKADPEPVRWRAPDVPDDLHEIVMKCLRKKKEERFADGAELAAALDAVRRVASGPEAIAPRVSALSSPSLPSDADPEEAPTAPRSNPDLGEAVKTEKDIVSHTPFVATRDDVPTFERLRRTRLGIGIAIASGLGGALVIGLIVAVVASHRSTEAPAPDPSALGALPAMAIATATPIAAPSASVIEVDTPEPAATPAAAAPHPSAPPHARPRTGKPADCAQPFTVDSKGVKIPKLHCL